MATQRAFLTCAGTSAVSTASTTWYASLFGLTPGNNGLVTTEANVALKFRAANATNTLKTLVVRVVANTRTTPSTVKIRQNGADTGLTVTIPASSGAVTLYDLSDIVTLADGDLLDWSLTTGTGAGSLTVTSVSVVLETAGQCYTYVGGTQGFTTASTGAIAFGFLNNATGSQSTGLTFSQLYAVEAATYDHFQVYVASNTRTVASTFTFAVGGTNKTQTISVGAGAVGLFEDTTHSDAVVAGNLISIAYSGGGTGTGTITLAFVAARYTSTTGGQFALYSANGGASLAAGVTDYWPILSSSGAAVTTEANAQISLPPCTTSNMAVMIGVNASSTTTTYNTRKNAANGNLTLSYAAAATGWTVDSTHSDTLALGDLVDFQGSGATTGTTRPFVWGFLFSAVQDVVPSVGSAAGVGAAAGVAVAASAAVGSSAGAGAATAVATGIYASVATAGGAGGASGAGSSIFSAVGTAIGAAFVAGISPLASVAQAIGRGLALGVGAMTGRRLAAFELDRCWVIPLNASLIECIQFDPISRILRVIYNNGLTIDVPGVSIGITSILAAQADPQAYVLGLVRNAR